MSAVLTPASTTKAKSPLELRRGQQHHLGAQPPLGRTIGRQDFEAGRGSKKEIAPFDEGQGRPIAIHLQLVAGLLDEGSTETGHGDVFGRGELLADAAGGTGRGRGRVGGVLFHHDDAALVAGGPEEKIGDRAAHHAAADDGDIACLGHGSLLSLRSGARPVRAGPAGRRRDCRRAGPPSTWRGEGRQKRW